ncbi:unnamed protein product [Alternaria alternata]
MRYHYALSTVLLKSKAQRNPLTASAPPAKEIQTPAVKEIQTPPAKETQDEHLPKRLIVCVDGTWGGPDGTFGNPQGNISTVFRAFASVKEGPVTDKVTGKRWQQQREYFDGLGDKRNVVKNLFSGAFGSGLPAEIKRVYEYCCHHTNGPNDEIYFFGFSRGAFTVRAVANLLCYMHVPKDLHKFSEHYQKMLELYPDVRALNKNVSGQTYSHFSCSTKPPVVRFVGAFDTVKAFTDNGLFDVLPHPHIQHYRHALALNEEREQFKPETATPDINAASSKHSILQAWFVGTHEDLGGANSKDGLSLYPLQWVLSEAESLGLTLGFRPIELEYRETTFTQEPSGPYMDDPVRLVMPPQSQRQKTSNNQSEMSLTLENGISVRLWDLCDIHENRKDEFKVKINSSYWGPAHKIVWTIKPRCIFDEHVLVGYCPTSGPERESRPDCESDKDLFKVLNECKSTIPVVVICSKVDRLRAMYRGEVDEEVNDDQLTDKERRRVVDAKVTERVDLFKATIEKALVKTSQGYPYMAGPIFTSEKDAKSIKNLVGVTYNNLNNEQVRAMFSQAQGVDVELKVQEAIKESLRLYKHAVRTSAVPLSFSGSISTTVVAPMIVGAICGIFNFHGISGDIAWRCIANVLVSNTTANVVQLFAQALGATGVGMAGTGVGVVPGAVIATSAAAVNIVSTPQFSRALLMCALDTIIIMDHAFWQCDSDQKEVKKENIDKSAEWFNNGRSSKVHEDIRSMIRIWNPFEAFDYVRLEKEMNAIVSRYRYQPGKSSCNSAKKLN